MDAEQLIATAARAPSVHNTQPWLFRVTGPTVELHCDPRRQLRSDPGGREMLISCGAALYGLRLAIRSQGYHPVIALFPDAGCPSLLATAGIGAPRPATPAERELLRAVPHRHTHRGAFEPGPFPPELTAGLPHDARAEGATLVFADAPRFGRLAAIVEAADFRLSLDSEARADIRRWTRSPQSSARDGVPAAAFRAAAGRRPGFLPQRDFDLRRGIGLLPADAGADPPARTAVLLTAGDAPADWLRAGQALHRLLLRAASRWVSASLFSQPLETPLRQVLPAHLAVPGFPQMILQLGNARTARATARRLPVELMLP